MIYESVLDSSKKHTFVICAYKESPYIEDCIRSLKRQKSGSAIKLATSTPGEYLEGLCNKYDIEYCVRNGEPGIADDWNYAYSLADTDYVTIAHQDDVYHKEYGREVIAGLTCNDDTPCLIIFSDYSELRDGNENKGGINLYIKRVLLAPLRNSKKNYKLWRKRFAIRFGNAISCPSVTYNKKEIDRLIKEQGRAKLFIRHFRSNLDWELWEWLSRSKGRFLFIPTILMSHRIHGDSETTATIRDNERSREDYEMFCRFWPRWFARIIASVYEESEKSNIV